MDEFLKKFVDMVKGYKLEDLNADAITSMIALAQVEAIKDHTAQLKRVADALENLR